VAKRDWHSLSERDRAVRVILKRSNWAVREFQDIDEAQIIQLCRQILGYAPTPAEWRWRMFQNPVGPAISMVASLREGERIIGHLAAVPIQLQVGRNSRELFFLVDSIVDPVYQGRGIHAALTMMISRRAAEQRAGPLGGLPNTQAYGPNLKMGGTYIFTMPVYFKIIDWAAIVRSRLHSNFLASVAGVIARPFRKNRSLEKSGGFRIEEVSRFDLNVEDLWNCVGPRFQVCAKRTSNLLNWRYFERPRTAYTVFSASSGDKWVGYVVVRLLDKWGMRLGTVVDLFFDPDCAVAGEILLRHAENHLRNNQAEALWALFACPPVYRSVLRRAGFFRAPRLKGVRDFHFVSDFVTIDAIRPDLFERDGDLLRREDAWFFSLGDSDLA